MRFTPVFCLFFAGLVGIWPVHSDDRTAFQTGAGYDPRLDLGSDQAIVYGTNPSFPDRMKSWQEHGYRIGYMTGISWGGYEAYYGASDERVAEEIQTDAAGKRFMHGHSTTVGYNVPTPAYLEFLKEYLNPAIDAGITDFYLEEPEYWAATGWSAGFKRAWQDYYDEPWEAPDSSPAAQFKASRLKYELYFNALSDIFHHIKDRAKAQGREAKCYVPTHSLINYAHWRIVSPESHLMDLDIADGYIAQVWTGTARTPNQYQGVRKERTFETAFLEYGQMLSMVRPTGRTVWFLADPVEDNPNHTWTDYEYNYKLTVTASLLWPEAYRYEVMPWPNRIFNGQYPVEGEEGAKAGISRDYATQLLAVLNALNDMKQDDIEYDMGSRGIGLLVSDTLMFQRANPAPSDPDLAPVYGLALPLLKHGVPIEPVQLECITTKDALAPYRVLLLTYEGQKPLQAAYHGVLANWVRAGGKLLVVGDGSDPYHAVPEWWNDGGTIGATPYDDLFERLDVSPEAVTEGVAVGEGRVLHLATPPGELQQTSEGADTVRKAVATLLATEDAPLETQNYLSLRRGPYIVAMGLDESVGEAPRVLSGEFIDLFDPMLPAITEKVLAPGTPALLYDLAWARAQSAGPAVAVASTRVRDETLGPDNFSFSTRGPRDTPARVVLRSERAPALVKALPEVPVEAQWDAAQKVIRLAFENRAETIRLAVTF